MIAGLEFVLIHVPDVAAARAFYTQKLGFQIEEERPDFLQFTQQLGGAVFAIGQGDSPRTSDGGIELWWSVSDADATYRDLIAKGVESLEDPHDMPFGRAFSIKDPAGNRISMFQAPSS